MTWPRRNPGLIALFLLSWSVRLAAQQPFATHCAGCHGEDARGTSKAPGLAMNPRVARQSAEQLREYLTHGNPALGMPGFADLSADEFASLTKYLRRINADTILPPLNEAEAGRRVTWGPPRPGDWRTYNGDDSGNRYSA